MPIDNLISRAVCATLVLLLHSTLYSETNFSGIMPFPIQGKNNQTIQIETKLPRAGIIWALDWSPNGKYIAVGSRAGHIRVYDSQSLRLLKILPELKGDINGIHWSPDSQMIAASGSWQDPRVIVWDYEAGSILSIGKHQQQVRSVRWSPSGHRLASTSHDGKIIIWNKEGGIVKSLDGANFGCVGIDWYDDDTIISSCWDNTIRLYSIKGNDSKIYANGDLGKKAVLSIDWHPSGKKFATGDYGNNHDPEHNVKIWSKEGRVLKVLKGHQKEIRALAWHPEGQLLATGGETVRLWNLEGSPVEVFDHHGGPIWSLDWSPDGNNIVTGDNDGQMIVWDISGKKRAVLKAHSSALISTDYYAKESRMLLGFSNGQIRLYDFDHTKSLSYQAHDRSINDIAWSPNGNYVAIASNDGLASIWTVNSDRLKKLTLLNGHNSSGVYSVAWSPDDRYLATGGYRSPVIVWDNTGKKIKTYKTDIDRVSEIQWKKGQPIFKEKEPYDYGVKGVPIRIKGEDLFLVPLVNNQFALFNNSGKLIEGNPDDFILITQSEQGIFSLIPLQNNI